MNQGKKNITVVVVAAIIVVGFGVYVWINPNIRDTTLTVNVTLSSHVVDQGSTLTIYFNASKFNAGYLINGTGENGLDIVPTYKNGTMIMGNEQAFVHYELSQIHNKIEVIWNLTQGNFGNGTNSYENCLLSAGYYKVMEGPQISNIPSYVSNYTFNIKNPEFQIKGIGYNLSCNDTNVTLSVYSSIMPPGLSSANLTIANVMYNTTTNKYAYKNFSRSLSVPGNLTLSYRPFTTSTHYITTLYIRTKLGTIMDMVDYGIFS